MTKKRTNNYKDFVNEVCEAAAKSNQIKSVQDLVNRWHTEIAPWFIRNDFIPGNWYEDLKKYLISKARKEKDYNER